MTLSSEEAQQGKGKTPMSNLVPFQFEETSISVITDDDHNPWWIASEVCDVLGIEDVSRACSRLDEDEKQLISLNDERISTRTVHPELKMLIVNEPGLYGLVLGSRKKAAKEFKRWITHEVLPQIRKTGQYTASLPQVKNPAHQLMIDTVVRIDTLEQELQEHQVQLVTQQQAMIALQSQQIEALKISQGADAKAEQAIHGQAWLTIHQYVTLHRLEHQMPQSFQQEYARYLIGYCAENNLRIYPQPVAYQRWQDENAYYVEAIRDTLPQWLNRRNGQIALRVG